MMNVRFHLAAAMLIFVAARSAHAAPFSINLSTGLDSSGTVQSTGGMADANWMIASQPARVVAPGNADWWGGWPANDAISSWIAKDPTTFANGVGTYSRAFDLSGIDLGTVSLTGKWAVDDEGTLTLNGHQIGAYQPHDGWNKFATQSFSVTDPAWFNAGSNIVMLTIAQTDNFFEGVRLQSTLTATTPEPSSLAVVAIAFAGLFFRRDNR
jgi:hypothetical protein